MVKRLLPYLKGYWLPTFLAPLMTVSEVAMEVYIPYLMSRIIDEGIAYKDTSLVVRFGLQMIVCALASFLLGIGAQWMTARASTGFAKNLRSTMFRKVQNFSFANVDHFSTGSLITRLTTDVQNVQMSYMMLIRTAIRAPLMFAFAIVMAFIMAGRLAFTFVIVVPSLIPQLAFP
jgi:ABC-type multidrug transport system fused ATPase/permease subunit